MEETSDKFYYVYSSSLDSRLQIKIGTLEGKKHKPEYDKMLADPMLKFSGLYQSEFADLMVECQVFDQNEPLTLPITTSYKAFSNRYNWNEWITLAIQFKNLPRTAQLAMTIYDCGGVNKKIPVGGTTITLFSKYGVFRQGIQDLRVWPNKVADGNYPTSTPGKAKDCGKEQMQRLSKLAKKHRNGHMTKVDWLDRLAFRELELVHEAEKRSSDYMYLMVEFPEVTVDNIPHNIVYFEQDGDEVYQFRAQPDIVTVPDQEILKENLVESKHHKLARSLRSGISDKDAKPNAQVRDMLNTIVSYPPTKQLSNEEQDYVWKFRFYLSNQKKALTKFLKCVNWNQSGEVRQALSMLTHWAPMDVEDALELLSPNFQHPEVRMYAISRLQQAPDEDLMLYLLQLVQALKYENFDIIKAAYKRLSPGRDSINSGDGDEKEYLEKRDNKESNATITSEQINMNRSASYHQADQIAASNVNSVIEVDSMQRAVTLPENLLQNMNTDSGNTDTLQSDLKDEEDAQDLASFLIRRACKNSALANYFYWYLIIECEDQEHKIKQDMVVRDMYLTVMKIFSKTLSKGNSDMQQRRLALSRQQKFIDKLVKLVKTVSSESGNRKKKSEKLQQLLASTDSKFNFIKFDPMPFPLDPSVQIKGIIPSKASLFKSALMPSKLHFITTNDSEYVAIFKHGDDLRQDQLILQMITLMDKLLRRENLDLKLTPYRVLAMSTKHGFVQFIDSITVAEVLANEGSILNFFRKHHPSETGPYGIAPEIMDTYVRSCAGYCVITYLLGVGDRHLDNLLLTTSGKLFHIDFGYILGRDPKPLPPPMKLSREMVEGMGGINSDHYQEFKKQCYTAFLHLRRHANLMLNLFSLMVDASVPDIALEPDKAVRKVQDKLRLDLGDEEAVRYLQNLLELSVTAVVAVVVEQLHKFAQYWRK
ncbi:PREDICTED: phosphatidylinositol 3-kinase catalytic subunit type 3 isoform X2 [Nicrophorus vespilloides]|uniref:Phosphatidylinositol 3-kinase catalytic subunit type 3 n=1 Tax=Nicrophorus vespilloides TaxID=110193 RepID=A0ABM1NJ66_NICVS|nr:PREDICTED: phosphatidylinositol 3-kinase catalytic subunit type 3 isoform X2 [Nicrophorus vespilloides]